MWSKYFTSCKRSQTGLGQKITGSKSLSTTSVLHDKDPLEELIKELQVNDENLKKTEGSKMFTQDPPISIRDIDGKPLEPIDINAWADPDELRSWFGNIDFLNKTGLGRNFELSTDSEVTTKIENGEKSDVSKVEEEVEVEAEGNKTDKQENHKISQDEIKDLKKTIDEISRIVDEIMKK